MSLLLKDPGAVLDYEVDWGADYLGEDLLASSRWEIEPAEDGGIALENHRFEPRAAYATISGGRAGRRYRLTNHVVTEGGREDRRSLVIRTEPR